jgi:hypothetical protein
MSLLTQFVQFFGKESKSRGGAAKPRRRNNRTCRIEELESRELLSVSTAEFAEIKAMYSDLHLGNEGDYIIREITVEQLANDYAQGYLQEAIHTAETTAGNDLIVVRTTDSVNTINLRRLGGTGQPCLTFNGSSTIYGSVTVVSYGDVPLTIHKDSSFGGLNMLVALEIKGFDTVVALAGMTITGDNGISGGSGGIQCTEGANVTITNFTVTGASGRSGIQCINLANVTVTNSTIAGNQGISGGGIGVSNAQLTLTNCVVASNTANMVGGNGAKGGGIFVSGGSALITNCTIVANNASGGGIFFNSIPGFDCSLVLVNTIVAYNFEVIRIFGIEYLLSDDVKADSGPVTGGNNIIGEAAGQSAFVNGVNGNKVGVGAVDTSALFVTSALNSGSWRNWDLSPTFNSIAVNAGNNALAPTNPKDLAGTPRIMLGTVDIGAFEFTPPTNYNAHDWMAVVTQGLWDYAVWSEGTEKRVIAIHASNVSLPNTIDLTGCIALKTVDFGDCGDLRVLNVSETALETLNITGCGVLETLNASNTALTSLNSYGCILLV